MVIVDALERAKPFDAVDVLNAFGDQTITFTVEPPRILFGNAGHAHHAVLWYADIRSFTPIADATPGPVLVEMLDGIFETLTAALRPHGGEVMKFLGDGMLASFAFVAATRDETCSHAFAAAAEAMSGLDRLNADRARMGKQTAIVDLALHL